METPQVTPPDPGKTRQISDTAETLPPEVAEAARNLANHFGPRDAQGRPKYYRIRELGAGGMGSVWLCWETNLRRHVALKFLLGRPDDVAVARFRREAQNCAGLRHPNVITIYEADVWQGAPYLAMDYIEGTDLAGAYARRDFSRDELVRWIAAVARALQAAHERGIVHRDIKPQNIFIDRERHPYLGDFGLAKSLASDQQLTAEGHIVGTPAYMAPEQAGNDDAKIGPRTDVYALGVVLYEGLTGRRPFQARDPISTLHKVLHEQPDPPRKLDGSIPAPLEAVVLRAMARDPSARFASARELAAALESPVLPAKRPPLWIGAVAAVLVAGLAAFLLWPKQEPKPKPEPKPEPPPKQAEIPTVKIGDTVIVGPNVEGLDPKIFKKTLFSGQDGYEVEIPGIDLKSVRMRQHWKRIWEIARAWKPDAVMVAIFGWYVRPDGTADASDPKDYQAGWMYSFFSAATEPERFDNERNRYMNLIVRSGRIIAYTQAGNLDNKLALPAEFLDSDTIWKLAAPKGPTGQAHLAIRMDDYWSAPLHRCDFTGAGPSGELNFRMDFLTGEIKD